MQNFAAADKWAHADFPLIAVRAGAAKANRPPEKIARVKNLVVILCPYLHD
jgi:hypothetical protein